ncbi:MAG: DUF3419 family protein [Flavobacteriales bacterium]|nr:DUF3419 family protein [Flavobacteriales bacterium]
MKSGILYGMCWEDPELFCALVEPDQRVLTVCSAGDIALSVLTKNPESVVAVDTNNDQLNLCRLKAACFEQLEYDACHQRIGTFEREKSFMEPLSIDNDLEKWAIKNALHQNTILQSGQFERYLNTFVKYLLPLAVNRSVIRRFLAAKDIQKQRLIYDKHINNSRYRFLFKRFFGRITMKRYGRHPDLLKHVKENPAVVLYKRMKHAWLEIPITDNYFFRFILNGAFKSDLALPPWAQKPHFDAIKSGTSKLEYVHDSMTAYLSKTEKKFDAINLSNITDVMTHSEADTLFDLCRTHLHPGGRLLIWNTMVDRKPMAGWALDEAETKAHWKNRMASFYGYLGIYNLA